MRSLDFFGFFPALSLGLHEQCSLLIKQKWKKYISLLENEHGSFFYQEVKNSLLSLFIGLKSNQKRLLNFYKELAIASLRCARHR
jgi:hypothetical protein